MIVLASRPAMMHPLWMTMSASTRGTVTKVVFSDSPAAAAGWYLYLREPRTSPATV